AVVRPGKRRARAPGQPGQDEPGQRAQVEPARPRRTATTQAACTKVQVVAVNVDTDAHRSTLPALRPARGRDEHAHASRQLAGWRELRCPGWPATPVQSAH